MLKKKISAGILVVLVIMAVFSGCAEPEPLRILVDADGREFSEQSCKSSAPICNSTVSGVSGATQSEYSSAAFSILMPSMLLL